MKKNILSLVLGATLVLPTIAMAAPNAVNNKNIMPADMRTQPVDNTLQSKVEGPDGELLATQPGAVDRNNVNMDTNKTNMATASSAMSRNNSNYQPTLAGERNNGNVTPADMRITSAPITLQSKVKGPDNELLATQPGEVEFSENRRFTAR